MVWISRLVGLMVLELVLVDMVVRLKVELRVVSVVRLDIAIGRLWLRVQLLCIRPPISALLLQMVLILQRMLVVMEMVLMLLMILLLLLLLLLVSHCCCPEAGS